MIGKNKLPIQYSNPKVQATPEIPPKTSPNPKPCNKNKFIIQLYKPIPRLKNNLKKKI